MAIIKGQQAIRLVKDAIVLDLGDVARQAQRLRQAAEDQARKIIEDAQRQAQNLQQRVHSDSSKEGYDQGFASGLEEGRRQGHQEGQLESLEQARQEHERIQQQWLVALDGWDIQLHQLQRQARHEVLHLALGLAQRVVRRAIEVDQDVVCRQLDDVLSHVLRPVEVVVRICPDDRPTLEQAMPRLMGKFPQFKQVQLVEDETVGRGGCVVDYGQGQIDATIETQMQRLLDLIMPGSGPGDGATDQPPLSAPG